MVQVGADLSTFLRGFALLRQPETFPSHEVGSCRALGARTPALWLQSRRPRRLSHLPKAEGRGDLFGVSATGPT